MVCFSLLLLLLAGCASTTYKNGDVSVTHNTLFRSYESIKVDAVKGTAEVGKANVSVDAMINALQMLK